MTWEATLANYTVGILLLLVLISFIAGFIDSIAGGGGLLILPALLLVGVPPQTALGTSKFTGAFGTMAALFNFIRSRTIVWKVIGHGIFFSLIGSYIGANCVLLISEEIVAIVIVALLPIGMAAALIPKKKMSTTRQSWSKTTLWFWIPLVCIVIGFYDGFFGPGTGSLLIMAFHIFFGISLSAASGTAKVFNLVSNVGAVTTFLFAGKCLLFLAIPMALANMIGNYIGSKLVIKKGDNIVRYTLILSVFILLITLIYKFIFL